MHTSSLKKCTHSLFGECIACRKQKIDQYKQNKVYQYTKSINALIARQYQLQAKPPCYTLDQFTQWAIEKGFAALYLDWLRSGYSNESAPCVVLINANDRNTLKNLLVVKRKDSHTKPKKQPVTSCYQLNHKPMKQVNQIHNGSVVATYESMQSAALSTGISRGNISQVCAGKRKTAGGYSWSRLPASFNGQDD